MKKAYIGAKIIEAEPMNANKHRLANNKPLLAQDVPGYEVLYPDGYLSWSPMAVFEEAYRPMNEGERFTASYRVSPGGGLNKVESK